MKMKELLAELRGKIEREVSAGIDTYIRDLKDDYQLACLRRDRQKISYLWASLSTTLSALDRSVSVHIDPRSEPCTVKLNILDTKCFEYFEFLLSELESEAAKTPIDHTIRGAADGVRGLISVIDEAMERCGSGLFPGATAEPSFEDHSGGSANDRR